MDGETNIPGADEGAKIDYLVKSIQSMGDAVKMLADHVKTISDSHGDLSGKFNEFTGGFSKAAKEKARADMKDGIMAKHGETYKGLADTHGVDEEGKDVFDQVLDMVDDAQAEAQGKGEAFDVDTFVPGVLDGLKQKYIDAHGKTSANLLGSNPVASVEVKKTVAKPSPADETDESYVEREAKKLTDPVINAMKKSKKK